MKKNKPNEVDEYIAGFPKTIRELLQQMQITIQNAAPDAEEKIGYGIPTFTFYGNLVHFAGYKNHIGFYPGAGGIEAFKKELSVYKGAKGSVQFPIDQPLPLTLVAKIVAFRIKQNEAKAIAKKLLRKCPNGHTYYKSSNCPTCSVCEKERKPTTVFLSTLSAPARRALENNGISSLQQLAAQTEAAVIALHGMGPASIPKLRSALAAAGLSFKK